MKKLLSLLLVLVLVLALCANVFAEGEVEGETDTGSQTAGDPIYPPETGSITIVNATLEKAYTAYKVFDATYSELGVAYTYSSTGEGDALFDALTAEGSPFKLSLVGDNLYSVTTEITDGKTIGNFLKGIIDSLSATVTNTATTSTVAFENLPYGYYLVTTTNGSTVSVNSAIPDVTIIDKNQSPNLPANGKQVWNDNEWASSNSASMGETVKFKIEAFAPLFDGDKLVTNYYFSDHLELGLAYVTNTMVIKANDVDITQFCDIDYIPFESEITTGKINVIDISIPVALDGEMTWDPNTTLTITYDALATDVMGCNAKNDVYMEWDIVTPDPEDPTKPENPNEDPQTVTGTVSSTETHTAGIRIYKTDEKGNSLKGVAFKLTGERIVRVKVVTEKTYVQDEEGEAYKLTNGAFTYVKSTPETAVYYESTSIKYGTKDDYWTTEVLSIDDEEIIAYATDDGTIEFHGLGAGTYTLTEVVTPDGYNSIEPITFTISYNANPGENEEPFTTTGLEITNEKEFVFDFTVINQSGVELPSTGGIGTTIFYVVGGLLVFAAVVLLITKKRLSAQA